MEFFSLSKPGREWNEDRCYACKDFAFVLDGATSLTKQKFSSLHSDAEWSSEWWREFLIKSLPDKSKPMNEIFVEGVKQYTQAFNELSNNEKIIDFPSTTVAAVRLINKQLEVFVLGDSPILFKTKTGLVFSVEDSRVSVVDSTTISMVLDAASKEKSTLFEARNRHPHFVMQGRKKKNTPFGYYVLSDSVEAINYGVYTFFEEKILDKVFILSDGYSQVYDTVKFLTPEKLMKKINTLKDAENIYAKLYKKQSKDKTGDKYPRYKLSDDATIVCLKF